MARLFIRVSRLFLLSSVCLSLLILSGCTASSSSVSDDQQNIDRIEVLLVSDHTLPNHLNKATAGANGIERNYIDPTLVRLTEIFQDRGITVATINVEDFAPQQTILDEATFTAAYTAYDVVLEWAVKHKITVISVHYDADILYDAQDPSVITYTGGAQIILDPRAVSESTLSLVNSLLFDYQLLESLNKTGLRIRPDYDDEIRYQSNLTLNIIGHSAGGGLLLEIGAQDQAIALFGSPQQIVSAIEKPLNVLVDGVIAHRAKLKD